MGVWLYSGGQKLETVIIVFVDYVLIQKILIANDCSLKSSSLEL